MTRDLSDPQVRLRQAAKQIDLAVSALDDDDARIDEARLAAISDELREMRAVLSETADQDIPSELPSD